MRNPIKYIFSSLIIAALLLAGCENTTNQIQQPINDTADQPAQTQNEGQIASNLKACDILTKDVAALLLSGNIGDGKRSDTGSIVSTCSYSTDDLSTVSLLVRSGTTDGAFDDAIAQSKTISGVDPDILEDLEGNRVYWAGGNLKQYNVLYQDKWLILSGFGIDLNIDNATQVMLKMLDNLKK